MRRPSHTTLALCALAVAGACSPGSGGATAPSWTEVSFSASNHMFFFSTGGWTSVPISPQRVWAEAFRLEMFGDGRYRFTNADGQGGSSAQRYILADAGFLTLELDSSSTIPTDGYGMAGMYGRAGASSLGEPGSTPDLFLSRISVVSGLVSGGGVDLGTRVVPGPVELAGDWHLLSLHVILEQAAASPDSVGRGARGAISIASGAPGTARGISGSGSQGTTGVTYGGTIQNLLASGGDGRCDLTVRYELAGQAADDRVMLAAARPDAVFGLDANANDGEAGQLLLVRKFDAARDPADPTLVAGRFPCVGRTLIVNPANGRGLQLRGVVVLGAAGEFTLEVAPLGLVAGYTFAGSWTLAPDGGLTLVVSDGNPGGPETWFAAIDRGYNTLVFVDDFVETGAAPRLQLGLALREKTPD